MPPQKDEGWRKYNGRKQLLINYKFIFNFIDSYTCGCNTTGDVLKMHSH